MSWQEEDATDIGQIVRNHETALARADEWKVAREGDFWIRILPPIISKPGEKKLFYRKFGRHYEFDMLRNLPKLEPRSIICPHLTLEQNCLACLTNRELFRNAIKPDGKPDPIKEELAKSTQAKTRFVCNVLPVTADNRLIHDGAGSPIKTWEFGLGKKGTGLFDQLIALFYDLNQAREASPTDPQKGCVIKVTFEPFNRSFAAKLVIATRVAGPIPYKNWAAERHNLDDYAERNCPTPEQLKEWLVPTERHGQTARPIPQQPTDAELAQAGDPEVDPFLVAGEPTGEEVVVLADQAVPQPGSPEFTAMLDKLARGELTPAAVAELLKK